MLWTSISTMFISFMVQKSVLRKLLADGNDCKFFGFGLIAIMYKWPKNSKKRFSISIDA